VTTRNMTTSAFCQVEYKTLSTVDMSPFLLTSLSPHSHQHVSQCVLHMHHSLPIHHHQMDTSVSCLLARVFPCLTDSSTVAIVFLIDHHLGRPSLNSVEVINSFTLCNILLFIYSMIYVSSSDYVVYNVTLADHSGRVV
jgi:hypothetical protein